MASSNLYLLPIIVFLWFPITFILTFIIAVLLGHVEPAFPYISDTGTFSPESCIFGQLVNIGSLLFACVIYVRYRQVREQCTAHELNTGSEKLNTVSMWTGIVGAVGIDFVANFQETNMFVVHMVSALVGFGCGVAYIILQTYLSYQIFPFEGRKWVLRLRLAISCLCTLTFFICILTGAVALQWFQGKSPVDMPKWSRTDGGWDWHVASTISEWATALLAMAYILTFTGEFRRVRLSEPPVYVEQDLLTESPLSSGEAA